MQKNTIIILTSNIQPEAAKKLGFHAQEEKETNGALLKGVKQFFRPELINRIDEQIVFRSLSEDNVEEILKTILNEISGDITERYNVTLEFTEEAEKCIAHKGYSPEYGVRELRRTVEKLVQIPLSNLILSGKLKKHKEWRVVCSNDEISLVPQS
jgi:ATP-dependent Clp protease ATP-binding subunit ClpC